MSIDLDTSVEQTPTLAEMMRGMDPPDMPPPRPKGRGGDLRRLIAEVVLVNSDHNKVTTLDELAQKANHLTNNAVGTAAKRGVGGRNGLNLWFDRAGNIRVCRQNVQACALALGDDLDPFVTEQLGMDGDNFAIWLGELPLARVAE